MGGRSGLGLCASLGPEANDGLLIAIEDSNSEPAQQDENGRTSGPPSEQREAAPPPAEPSQQAAVSDPRRVYRPNDANNDGSDNEDDDVIRGRPKEPTSNTAPTLYLPPRPPTRALINKRSASTLHQQGGSRVTKPGRAARFKTPLR